MYCFFPSVPPKTQDYLAPARVPLFVRTNDMIEMMFALGRTMNSAQSEYMCLVQTPLWIKVKLGKCFIARASTAQDDTGMFAVNEYPTIVLDIITTILQPACSSAYFCLDSSSSSV